MQKKEQLRKHHQEARSQEKKKRTSEATQTRSDRNFSQGHINRGSKLLGKQPAIKKKIHYSEN